MHSLLLSAARDAALRSKIKDLESKLAAKNRGRSPSSGSRTEPSQVYKRLLKQGLVVDTDTHVGFGKLGEPNQDIYEKSWLAQQEGCAVHERCWLTLIARSGVVMCPTPASCGGEDAPCHSFKPDLVADIKQSSLDNAAARNPDAGSRVSTPSGKSAPSSRSSRSSRSFSQKKRKQR